MTKTMDDFEAVRAVTAALEGFDAEVQERILRWAREKLGLASPTRDLSDGRSTQFQTPPVKLVETAGTQLPPAQATKDLKSFVEMKTPKNDIQFATLVAYFYRFEAPPAQHKDEIDAPILQDACRLVGRNRFSKPDQTLRNAKNQGLLDSGTEAGKFTVNTVGENLVAMALPGQSVGAPSMRLKRTKSVRKSKTGKR